MDTKQLIGEMDQSFVATSSDEVIAAAAPGVGPVAVSIHARQHGHAPLRVASIGNVVAAAADPLSLSLSRINNSNVRHDDHYDARSSNLFYDENDLDDDATIARHLFRLVSSSRSRNSIHAAHLIRTCSWWSNGVTGP
jgi:hypothetical protein